MSDDTMPELPPLLYRGDCDPANERQLRTTWGGGCLLTNLANGGSGREIFTAPLTTAVERHVTSQWKDKTHFLSLSSSRERALVFAAGRGRSPRDLLPTNEERWDAALITIDTRKFDTVIQVEQGVYRCAYAGRMPVRADSRMAHQPFGPYRLQELARALAYSERQGRPVTVVLIDVVTYLDAHVTAGQVVHEGALPNAKNDSEWLILPVDPCDDAPGEFTAKLDDACVSEIERFLFR